jgi:tRNA(Ile)-lysidine synthase
LGRIGGGYILKKESEPSFLKLETTIAGVLEKYLPGVFLAAVSGGADSTAMLVALAAIRNQGIFTKDIELRCIHVEHGIRSETESKGDAEFVRSLCEKLQVPCKIVSIKPGKITATAKELGIGIEATARLYRRKAWFRELKQINTQWQIKILTAHTADDMLETVLMRVLRGSGPSGLSAMPVNRGRILRPLITLSRQDVLGYLTGRGIAWREDSTNTNVQFLRNRIRHRLIPTLNENFPQWRGAIAALAKTQSLIVEFINSEAAGRVEWKKGIRDQEGNLRPLAPVGVQGSRAGNFLFTDADTFFAQPAIICEEALFQGINKLGFPAKIKRKNIRSFAEGKVAAVDFGSLRIRRDSQWVMIVATTKEDNLEDFSISHSSFLIPHFFEFGFSLLIIAAGSYNLKGIAIEVSVPSEEGMSSLKNRCLVNGCEDEKGFLAILPLILRPYFKGDRIINKQQLSLTKGEAPGQNLNPAVITAEDSMGSAAFIGIDGSSCRLLQRRDDEVVLQMSSDDEKRCAVQVRIV